MDEGECDYWRHEREKGEGQEREKGDDGGEFGGAMEVEEEDGEDGERDFRVFQRRLYTDEAYERLRKECYRRVWSMCFEGG